MHIMNVMKGLRKRNLRVNIAPFFENKLVRAIRLIRKTIEGICNYESLSKEGF